MMRTRARAASVIGAIVLGSALVGAALDRMLLVRPHRRGYGHGSFSPTPDQEAKHRREGLDRMSRELDLSALQRAAIDSIMRRTDSSLREVRLEMQPRIERLFEASRTEISARLDSEQRIKFQEYVAKWTKRR